MDNQFIVNAVFTIVMTLIGAVVALGVYNLKEIKNTLSTQLEAHDKTFLLLNQKIDETKENLHEFKIHVHKNFISKEEHLHSSEKLDGKLDTLIKQMHNIDKNVIRIAAVQGVDDDN